jgi:hypothetical protein
MRESISVKYIAVGLAMYAKEKEGTTGDGWKKWLHPEREREREREMCRSCASPPVD